MVGVVRGPAVADPAEFVKAKSTSHMIATFDALDPRLAHRTERHVLLKTVTHLICPLHVGLTCRSRMVLILALKADLCLAFGTLDKLDFIVFSNQDAVTVRLHAVA